MAFMAIVGVGIVASGLLSLCAKDYLWHFEDLSLRLQGIEGKRTAWWYVRMNLQGAIGIIIGGLLIYLGIGSH